MPFLSLRGALYRDCALALGSETLAVVSPSVCICVPRAPPRDDLNRRGRRHPCLLHCSTASVAPRRGSSRRLVGRQEELGPHTWEVDPASCSRDTAEGQRAPVLSMDGASGALCGPLGAVPRVVGVTCRPWWSPARRLLNAPGGLGPIASLSARVSVTQPGPGSLLFVRSPPWRVPALAQRSNPVFSASSPDDLPCSHPWCPARSESSGMVSVTPSPGSRPLRWALPRSLVLLFDHWDPRVSTRHRY